MKYFYCDSCFLITSYQNDYLKLLKPYKQFLFISESQLRDELLKPNDLKIKVIDAISIISENTSHRLKTIELRNKHITLSYYDCLALAFAIIDNYTLITNDKALIKAAIKYNVNVISCEQIIEIIKT